MAENPVDDKPLARKQELHRCAEVTAEAIMEADKAGDGGVELIAQQLFIAYMVGHQDGAEFTNWFNRQVLPPNMVMH